MKKTALIVFIFCLAGNTNNMFAQTDTIINGKKYTLVEDEKTNGVFKNKKHYPPLDSTFLYKGKKYKYYNNWLSAGAGTYYNFTRGKKLGFALGLDYNFHIKHYYYQLGINLLGKRYGSYDDYQLHLGFGKRMENTKYHLAGFIGLSYTSGRQLNEVDSVVFIRYYNRPGIYLQVEGVKKITYDIGVGATIFSDVNEEQTLLGCKITLYFSGSYRGRKDM